MSFPFPTDTAPPVLSLVAEDEEWTSVSTPPVLDLFPRDSEAVDYSTYCKDENPLAKDLCLNAIKDKDASV